MPINFDDNHWFVCCEETNCCEPDADEVLAGLDAPGLGVLAWPVVAELGDEEVELAADGLLSIDEPPELVLCVCWEFAGGSVLGLD
jgi:hypothetical protein